MRATFLQLSKQSLSYGSGNLSKKLLALFLLPLYARYLSPEDYGIISTVGIIAFLTGTILSLKQDAAVLRFYYDYKDSEEDLRRYLGTVVVLVASFALFAALLLSLFSRSLFDFFLRGFSFSYVLYGLWIGVFASVSVIPQMLLRVREQASRFALLQVASFLVTTTLIIYFVVYQQEGALGQVKGMLIGTSAFFAIYLILLVKEVRLGFSVRHVKKTILYGIPLIPQGIAEWVIGGSDRFFLVHYSTLASVGLYSLGYTLGSAVSVFIFSIQQAMGPFFFSTANNQEEAEKVLPRIVTYFVLATSTVVIIVSIFGREVIAVMASPHYMGAAVIVPIIASLYLFRPLSLFAAYGILHRRRSSLLVVSVLISAGLNVILNFLLIPPYGMIGAALATWMTYVADAGMTLWLAQRIYPLAYEYGRLGKIFLLSGIVIGSGILVPHVSLWLTLAIKLGLAIGYPALLYASGFFSGEEVSALRNMIRRARIGFQAAGKPAQREG